MSEVVKHYAKEHQRHGSGCFPSDIVDRAVRALRAATDLTNIQEVGGKSVENGLVKSFCGERLWLDGFFA